MAARRKDPATEALLEALELLRGIDEEAATAWAERQLAAARGFVENDARHVVFIVRECPDRRPSTPGVPDPRAL